MENKPVSDRMYGFLVMYDMHTKFYHSVLDGIKEEDATKRLDTKANHIAWLAGSLLQERFELANLLGVALKAGADELFKHHQGIKDDVKYPTISTYEDQWNTISPILREKLVEVSDDKLDEIINFPAEQMSFPLFEMVSFNTYREANCIGQIALWRRLLGYDGMKYM